MCNGNRNSLLLAPSSHTDAVVTHCVALGDGVCVGVCGTV